jgi:hypothetical protein
MSFHRVVDLWRQDAATTVPAMLRIDEQPLPVCAIGSRGCSRLNTDREPERRRARPKSLRQRLGWRSPA